MFLNNPVTAIPNGLIGHANYDTGNPIYARTQKDGHYAASVQLLHRNPFGWQIVNQENSGCFVSASYLIKDTIIDFFDIEAGTLVYLYVFNGNLTR